MTQALAKPLGALAAAFVLMALAVWALGANPIIVFSALVSGAAGNSLALTDSLVKATPLVFTGLAIAIAFHGSLWNIGAEGQLLVGALAGTAVGINLGAWPNALAVSIVLIVGAIAGAMWGGFCGWLKARRRVNEVISTIMMNFIALELASWAVHGPLMESTHAYPESDVLPAAACLPTFLSPSRLNAGMILAVMLAVAVWLLIYRSEYGFKLRAFGKNRRASSFFGIGATRMTIVTFAASGALAGLGGAVQLAAINHRLYERFSPGWGFEAIAVALVARLNPLAILLSALFFGALDNGAQAMQRSSGVSPVLVQVVQALVIFILLAIDAAGVGRTVGEPSVPAIVSPAPEIPNASNA